MGVCVLLKGCVGAIPRAVVCLVSLRGDDEVPAEFLEVHSERITTANVFGCVFVAVETYCAFGSTFSAVCRLDFHERNLEQRKII